MSSEREYTLRNGYKRARHTALEYGRICPACSSPKSPQALRCRRCFAETLTREVTAFDSHELATTRERSEHR
jgi:hypothetical protein